MKALRIALAAAGLAFASLSQAQQVVTAPAPAAAPAGNHVMEGVAAWYGHKFAGRRTASGKRFNPNALTAAHPTLPFGTRVNVINTRNNRGVVVTINDRGPTSPKRMLDVSVAAARKLGFVRAGLTDVKLEIAAN
jgi:rare lipoprotein A